jgi:hypothetical protein
MKEVCQIFPLKKTLTPPNLNHYGEAIYLKFILKLLPTIFLMGFIYACSTYQPIIDNTYLAEKGDVQAQLYLGRKYYKGENTTKDFEQALYWYTKAAEQGNSIGQFYAGLMHYEGKGTPNNYYKAIQWLTKSAEQGYDEAQLHLGRMYYQGEGFTTDDVLAYAWLNLVSSQENINIKNELDSIRAKMSLAQIEDATELSNKFYEKIYYKLPRRSFNGFSIITPINKNWIITSKDRLNISLFLAPSPNPKHSIIAFAGLKQSNLSLSKKANLKELVEQTEKLGESDKRFKDYNYYISDIRINERDCIKTEFSAEDHGVPNAWGAIYIVEGLTAYCPHPNSSNLVVTAGYSQRYKKGGRPLIIKNEMQQFIKSIKFEQID